MKRTVLCCALALAGCFDFSRFDHLPDGGADLANRLTADLGTALLIDEPFDTLDPTRWIRFEQGSSMVPPAAFTIDPDTHIEGTGALRVDVSMLDGKDTGALSWIGSQLPTANGSRHLRFYLRYDGEPDGNIDLVTVTSTDGSAGVSITLTPVDVSNPSAGAVVVLERYPGAFGRSSVVVHDGDWHCLELGIDQIGTSATWQPTLRVDDVVQAVTPAPGSPPSQLHELNVGFSLAQSPQTGTKQAWIDAVVLTNDSAPIGCPYPLPP